MLELRTLGAFRVSIDGSSVSVGSQKTALFLTYLRSHVERRVLRSELIELLWGNDTRQARHSLSQCLYSLKRSLPGIEVLTSSEEVRLHATNFHFDLEDFQRAARSGLYAVAADAYHGQFLDGITDFPTRTAEEWIEQMRRTSANLALTAFRGMCRQAEVAGNWQDVDKWAEKLLELDRFDEEAHAHRIRAAAAQFGIEAACRLAKEVRSHFVSELGAISSQDLNRLCDKYADTDAVGATTATVSLTPIRGRTEEFRVLSSRWLKADSGSNQIAVVSGPAGIGKTRLGTHFLRWAAVRGSRTLHVKASHSDTHLPYSVIVRLLRSGVRTADVAKVDQPWRGWLAKLLPEYREKDEASGDPPQRELFESVAQLLAGLCSSAPLTILVDDFDLCDHASAWLISFIFQRLANEGIVLVLASRKSSDEFPEDAAALTRSLNAEHIAVLNLVPLDQAAASQIVRDRVSAAHLEAFPADLVGLIDQANGIPYYILQAAEAFVDRARTNGASSSTSIGSYAILSNVRLLEKGAQRVLRVLAVLGYRAPRIVVRSASHLTQAEFVDALASLTAKQLVRDIGQHIEFEHDLIREAVLADVSEEEARELHRQAAYAISSTACPQPARLAIHYTAADIPEQAYMAAMKAAAEAARLHAADDAEFFFRLAISKAPTPLDRSLARAALVEYYCGLDMVQEAQTALTSWPDAWSHLREESAELMRCIRMLADASCTAESFLMHIERVRSPGDDLRLDDRRLQLLRHIIGFSHQIGSPIARDITVSVVEKFSTMPETSEKAKFIACIAMGWAIMEGGDKAITLADLAVDMARALGDTPSIAGGLLARATVYMLLGRLHEAERDFTACGELVQLPGLLAFAVRRNVNRSVLLIETCRPSEAHASLEAVLAYHVPLEQFFIRGNMALAAYEMGDVQRLRHRTREMRAVNAVVGLRWVDPFVDSMEAYCLAQTGQQAESDRLIEGLARTERKEGTGLLGPDPSYAQAMIGQWLSGSSTDRALEYLDDSARQYAGRNVLGELRVRLMRARVLLRTDQPAGLRELREVHARCRAGGALSLLRQCEEALALAGC